MPTSGFALKEESLSIEVETMNERTIYNEAELQTKNSNISRIDQTQFLATSKPLTPIYIYISLFFCLIFKCIYFFLFSS